MEVQSGEKMAEQDWKTLYREQLKKRKAEQSHTGATQVKLEEQPAEYEQDRPRKRDEQPKRHEEPEIPRPKPQRTITAPSGVALIRKIVVAIWLGITGIQIIIWLLIGIFGKQFPDPWWLWTGVSGAVVVGIIWYVSAEIQNHKRKRN